MRIAWFKGKWKVKVLLSGGRSTLVEALETITMKGQIIPAGDQFVTLQRLCWSHPREG